MDVIHKEKGHPLLRLARCQAGINTFYFVSGFFCKDMQLYKFVPLNVSLETIVLIKILAHIQMDILNTRITQPTFTCSKLTIEKLEQGVKYIQN